MKIILLPKRSRQFLLVLILIISSTTYTKAQQWVQTRGPGGGAVTDILEKNGALLIATAGGIFRSTDNGDTWVRSMSGITTGVGIETLAATNNFIYAGSNGFGLYKSQDNGVSWTHIDLSVLNIFISKLFSSHDTLYAGCAGCGVYRSVDEAASFTAVNNGYPASAYVYSFARIGQYLFTGLRGNGGTVGVYRTAVDAINWQQVNNGLVNFPSVIDLAVKGSDLLVTTESFNGAGLFRSADFGNNWANITPALPAAEHPTSLAVADSDIYIGTEGDAPYRSVDNAASFQRVNNGLKPLTVFCLLSATNGFFVGYERGIARTTDNAASWQRKVRGLTITSVTSLFAAGDTTLYATTRTQNTGSSDGVFYTNDEGQNWISIDKGLLPSPQASNLVKAGNNIILGTSNFGLYIKTPLDTAFKRATGIPGGLNITALISSGQYVLAGIAGENELYRSTDYGLTWTASNNGFDTGQEDQVYCFHEKQGVIYAGGFNALYKSTDFGLNWTSAKAGIYPGIIVSGITSLGNDLFACTQQNRGIYQSINNGTGWTQINNGLPAIIDFNTILAANGNLFAGASDGVYRSLDAGSSWMTMNDSLLPNRKSLCLAVVNNKLFLGTDETAVWGNTLFDIVPIGLQNFSARENNGVVNLNWQTPAFLNTAYFDVQRSVDGQNFVSIAMVNAAANVNDNTYNVNDDKPNIGYNYYRLVMNDATGDKKYSQVILVNINANDKIRMVVTPNPATTQSVIRITGKLKGRVYIDVFDVYGRMITVLYPRDINSQGFSTTLDCSSLKKGFYIVRFSINNEMLTDKLIIQ